MDVDLGPFAVELADDFGPRITGLRKGGGAQVLAVLDPDIRLELADHVYPFRGGHRVWASPEIPDITYAPDDHSCAIRLNGSTATIVAPPDDCGLRKTLNISAQGETLRVESHLVFTRPLGVDVAAWAITQFAPGGTVIVSFAGDDTGPLPNRQVIIWPYTHLSDARIHLDDEVVVIDALPGPNLKLGVGEGANRLGYLREGTLFIKELMARSDGPIPDLGARAQVFVGTEFCELEFVSGTTPARAGGSASVVERWAIHQCDDREEAISLIMGGGR